MICKHCECHIEIRNPTGWCDHLYYPDYCAVCQKMQETRGEVSKMSESVSVQLVRNENSESLEIGTPGKMGCLKVYFDASKPVEEAKARVDVALQVREYAANKLLTQVV